MESEIEELIENEFPNLLDKSITYLDHAGASLYSKTQVDNIHSELQSNLLSNPHSNISGIDGLPDLQAKIRNVRQEILRFFNTNEDKHRVIFTSGATQSLKLVVENFPWNSNQSLLYLDESHTSVVGLRQLVSNCKILPSKSVHFQDQNGGLFVCPAMSNFNGTKYPISEWIDKAHENHYKVLLDAASFASTNELNLGKIKADFVAISFYKIFGLPTGLGALIVANPALETLEKKYFGGGTVEMHLVHQSKQALKNSEHGFEDGTVHYQGILALKHGFDLIAKFHGIACISLRTFKLAKYLHDSLKALKHCNNQDMIQLYHDNDFTDPELQGGLVNFNILQKNGQVLGFTEFQKIASHHRLVVRVGCFCNIGSCQTYLGITDEDIERNHQAGHVCGDNVDMINGKPTGSIRVSFGHYSMKRNADLVLSIIQELFASQHSINGKMKNEGSEGQPLISAIYVYPIKSCGALKITSGSWPLSETCLLYDRQFVIMQGRSTLTLKSEPLLCQIKPQIDLENQIMTLEVAWESSKCSVNLDPECTQVSSKNRQLCTGKVCGDNIEGVDCGDEVADWLELILGLTGLRLIQLSHRRANLQSLANEAQFLILNRSSAQELYEETKDSLEADQGTDWLLDQFRGNFVLDHCPAYSENQWKRLEIGSLILDISGLCTRCNVIGVNQANSQRVQEPLSTLSKRQNQRFKFGVLASGSSDLMDGWRVKIGQAVKIIS